MGTLEWHNEALTDLSRKGERYLCSPSLSWEVNQISEWLSLLSISFYHIAIENIAKLPLYWNSSSNMIWFISVIMSNSWFTIWFYHLDTNPDCLDIFLFFIFLVNTLAIPSDACNWLVTASGKLFLFHENSVFKNFLW